VAAIEMMIDSVRVSLTNYHRVVILKEKAASRYLPIWIGPAEADAIAIKLHDVTVPRPMTHDLLQNVIVALGANIASITVCDLKNDTFYARIRLTVDHKDVDIDSRPSDALALAVRTKVPIFAEEAVLERAGILMDPETGKPLTTGEAEGSGTVGEEEMKRLSAFKDVVEKLDLENLGKDKG